MPTTDRIEINPQVMLGCHGNLQGSTIGMRRAAAGLMLGWLVLLGRSPHVFAIAKMRNLEDVFPRQALSTGWGGSFRDSENEKKRIQTEAITDGQRKRT